MAINFDNFFNSDTKKSKLGDFQDLDHLDGLSISTTSANLYNNQRDDLVMFYFREGAEHGSVYTQSKIVSENIKWNLNLKNKKISALLINTRNANTFTGKRGYQGLKDVAEELSIRLSDRQKKDEDKPVKIKYTQNKYIWTKAALGIMTTDLVPKLAMEECKIGTTNVKIYGIAKGSGMIFPNMATTLGFVFTDANLSSNILQKLLRKNIETTFNAISCDGDTSTNDMVSIFSTGVAKNSKIKTINDLKIKDFDIALHSVLLNLAKRVASDGEGASKFISIFVNNAKTQEDAKKVAFSIANSPLVKTAIAGEDCNYGRVIMAIGKSGASINLSKLIIKFGDVKIIEKGQLSIVYNEDEAAEYMKNEKIELYVDIGTGKRNFEAYTMDLTKKYIEINADYRT